MRILVAEDEALLRMSCEEFLVDLGHTVWTANDGQEALDLLRTQTVDVLITDLSMPRMTGYQLLEEVVEAFPALICIVISAYAREQAIQQLTRARDRLLGYVQKPYAFIEIERLLDDAERRIGCSA